MNVLDFRAKAQHQVNNGKLGSRLQNQDGSEGPWSSAQLQFPDGVSALNTSTLIKHYADSSICHAESWAGQQGYKRVPVITIFQHVVTRKR